MTVREEARHQRVPVTFADRMPRGREPL